MSRRWVSGDICWVPDARRAYVAAKVSASGGDGKVEVELDPASLSNAPLTKVEFRANELLERAPGAGSCVPEMDELEVLNQAEVLNNVDALFQQGEPSNGKNVIYSSVGPVLVAMNPFKELPLYGDSWVAAYHSAAGNAHANKKLGPHAYRTAEEAYQGLRIEKTQSVVISGESGAGKTVTNRKMLEYLCEVSKDEQRGAALKRSKSMCVSPSQITESALMLESFGNATTTRNDNSSRFGKLTNLYFDPEAKYTIVGCGVTHYLLERSRITGGAESERNYHIFYQLTRGKDAAKYELQSDPAAYAYAKQGSEIKMPSINDATDFDEVLSGMKTVGFGDKSISNILGAIAAVLNLGNVKFSGDRDSCDVDAATSDYLTKACSLLGVDAAALGKAMTTKITKVAGSEISSGVGKQQAEAQRNTVAKMVYSVIFDHIVVTIDRILRKGRGVAAADGVATIGLLDIFGFEDMQVNGFEQLFINFTNERIQHLFNCIMFEREKQVYADEGISADFLVTPTNIECVELFLGKSGKSRIPGIVNLLAGQCRTGQADENVDGEKFVSVLNRQFGGSHKYFHVSTPQEINAVMKQKGLKDKSGTSKLNYKECFQIKHYAGDTTYTVQNFVPKSRDALLPHLGAVLRASKNEEVAELFSEETESKLTVGEKFKLQLEELANTLQRGETLFVRCIKSNPKKAPQFVDRPMVLDQLIRGGVMAALEMRASGLPDRMLYPAFLYEFGLLERGHSRKSPKSRCETILGDLLGEDAAISAVYACGNTKVFMKSGVLAFLRSAARFKTAVYARRIHKSLRSARVRKIDSSWKRVEEAEEFATARGLSELAKVKEALSRGRERVKPVWEALEAAKKVHGLNFDAIMKALEPHEEAMKHVTYESVLVADAVERIDSRKREAQQIFSMKLSSAMDSAMAMLDKISQVESEIADCADIAEKDELDKCQGACNEARSMIDKLRTEILPSLKEKGPTDVDLEADGDAAATARREAANSCPKADALLEEAGGLVQGAEDLGVVVLRVRREFANAVTEIDANREAAQNKLDALQSSARACIEEGLQDIVDKIAAAVHLSEDLGRLLRAAKDPEGYRTKASAFQVAVEVAEDAVEKGKEELARRARERAERRRLLSLLDNVGGKCADAIEKLSKERITGSKLNDDAVALDAISRDVPVLRQVCNSDLADFKARVEALQEKAWSVLEAIEEHIEDDRKERRNAFAKRASVFGAAVGKRVPVQHAMKDDAEPAASFIEQQGLTEHEPLLLQMAESIKGLKDAGISRSKVSVCTKHYMDVTYKLAFEPASR